MSTHRYFNTSFWQDEWIQSLDPSERYTYIYLFTNPMTNIAGVYKIGKKQLIFDIGFSEDVLMTILKRFERDKKAYYYNGYIILPNFPKHQNYKTKKTIEQGIDSILESIPEDVRKYMVGVSYQYDSNYYIKFYLNLYNINLSYTPEPDISKQDDCEQPVDNSIQLINPSLPLSEQLKILSEGLKLKPK